MLLVHLLFFFNLKLSLPTRSFFVFLRFLTWLILLWQDLILLRLRLDFVLNSLALIFIHFFEDHRILSILRLLIFVLEGLC